MSKKDVEEFFKEQEKILSEMYKTSAAIPSCGAERIVRVPAAIPSCGAERIVRVPAAIPSCGAPRILQNPRIFRSWKKE